NKNMSTVKKFTKWLKERDRVLYESLDEAFKGKMQGAFTEVTAYRGIEESKFHEVKQHGLIPIWDFKRDPFDDFDMDTSDFDSDYGYNDPYDEDMPDMDPQAMYADLGIDINKKYTFISDDEYEAQRYGTMILRFPMPADAILVNPTNDHYFVTATL